MSKETDRSVGVGFFGLLGIVFIALKLANVITWSWWYVTMPLWGPFALFLAIATVIVLVGSGAKAFYRNR